MNILEFRYNILAPPYCYYSFNAINNSLSEGIFTECFKTAKIIPIFKNSNTLNAIIEFLDYVYSSLDKKQSTIAVYLDLSKAFDTVNHEILMSKLQHNSIRGVMLSWFKSYLSNRKQYLSVKNFSSSMSNITLGVPHCSVFGQ